MRDVRTARIHNLRAGWIVGTLAGATEFLQVTETLTETVIHLLDSCEEVCPACTCMKIHNRACS